MAVTDILTRIPAVRSLVDQAKAEGLAVGRSERVIESAEYEDDYAFRRLRGAQGVYDLPDAFTNQVLRLSHQMYHSHGIADFILQRAASILLDGGLTYTLNFDFLSDEATPDERQTYALFQSGIEKRVSAWWNDSEVDIPERQNSFVDELLMSGEHGWRFDVNRENGWVRVGDMPRSDVQDVEIDAFDRARLRKVIPVTAPDETPEPLEHLRKDPLTKALTGTVAYHRLRSTPTMRRGKPLLQPIVDELLAEKKFRVLSYDRAIARMATFLETTLEGYTPSQVDAYAKSATHRMPENGSRVFVNEKIKNNFVSAKIEALDVTNMVNTMITVVAAALGWPPSWFGIGQGSNRAIAETQQDPALRNLNRQKRSLLAFFRTVVEYVIDQALAARYIVTVPSMTVPVEGEERGVTVRKPLRECVTVLISTVPLAESQREQNPLAATKAALEIFALLADLRATYDADVLDEKQLAAILNAALAQDRVGVEVYGDMFASAAASGTAPGTAPGTAGGGNA